MSPSAANLAVRPPAPIPTQFTPAPHTNATPISLSGKDSAQTRETRAFAARLAAAIAPVPIELYDERFTTSLAAMAPGAASLDSRAAAVLLDEWLHLPNKEATD